MEDKIRQLRLSGKGYKLIARELNISRDMVRYYCNKLGLVGVMGDVREKKEIKPKLCIVCANELGDQHKKYCCLECKIKNTVTTYKNECAHCKNEFVTKTKLRKENRCCSTACGKEYSRKLKYPWKYEDRECNHCGIKFLPKRMVQRFCSGTCAGKGTMESNLNGAFSQREYVLELHKRYGGVIEPLTEYVGRQGKIRLRCKMCDLTFTRVAGSMLKVKCAGCPRCSESQSIGVTRIERWLISNNVNHEREYRFDDCRNILPLPFDFAILSNGRCIALIEFNGQQHNRVLHHWGGERQLNDIKLRDDIKRRYCIHNGIPLIDIDYSEQDKIEEILNDVITVSISVRHRTVEDVLV